MVGGNLAGESIDHVGLGLRHGLEQPLQTSVLHFLDGVLVEALAVAGDLDKFIELTGHAGHGSYSCKEGWKR